MALVFDSRAIEALISQLALALRRLSILALLNEQWSGCNEGGQHVRQHGRWPIWVPGTYEVGLD
ncbi:hypothetical protein [Rhizobium sp. BK376]|jgi:hypothetical protein|uniref:hypothetical protein n=1 Tax=Rhizobium sp. BK376 TaxID=2512149 RepID=UPI001A9EE2C3|nr:hypothetical protein [Rhizobium sp. BK376]